jgi:hypothetical protein
MIISNLFYLFSSLRMNRSRIDFQLQIVKGEDV